MGKSYENLHEYTIDKLRNDGFKVNNVAGKIMQYTTLSLIGGGIVGVDPFLLFMGGFSMGIFSFGYVDDHQVQIK